MEKWRSIKGMSGYYEASTLGRIRSLDRIAIMKNGHQRMKKGQIIMPQSSKNGYYHFTPCLDGKQITRRIARLIAQTWIPNPENLPVVNHLNLEKTDNRVENLEWTTISGNTIHAIQNGVLYTGENKYNAKLTYDDIPHIFDLYKYGFYQHEIGTMYGVVQKTIGLILRRKAYKLAPYFSNEI